MKTGIPYHQLEDESRGQDYNRRTQVYYRCLIALATGGSVLLVIMALCNLLIPRASSSSPHPVPDISLRLPNMESCTDPCRIVLVESIPEGLEFNSSTTHPSIFQAWMNLIGTEYPGL